MLKRTLLLLVILFMHRNSHSQKKILERELGFRRYVEPYGIQDGDYFITKGWTGHEEYNFCVFNRKNNLYEKLECKRNKVTIYDFVSDEQEINIYFADHPQIPELLTFSKSFNRFIKIDKLKFDPEKRILTHLFINGKFSMLSANTDKGQIELDVFEKEKLFERKVFKLSDKALLKHLARNRPTYVNQKNEAAVEKSFLTNKVYVVGEKIIITIDDFNDRKNETTILTLNTKTANTGIENVPLPFQDARCNSFLNDSLFLVLGFEKKLVGLKIYSYPSLKLLKDFTYHKGDEVTLLSSPLITFLQILEAKDKVKWQEDVKKRKVGRWGEGVPAISALPSEKGIIRLTLGATVYQKGTTGVSFFQTFSYCHLSGSDFSIIPNNLIADYGYYYLRGRRMYDLDKLDIVFDDVGTILSAQNPKILIYYNQRTRSITFEDLQHD